MAIIPNSQSFSANASGITVSALAGDFRTAMDTVLLGLGRDITIHLPPGKNACPDVSCVFNSTYKRYTGANGKICNTCKGQGFLIEPMQTIYLANIRWTNEPFNENSRNIEEKHVAGRVAANFCRTKTVATSVNHVRQSIGATIDGVDVELFQEPRTTGFGAAPLLYTISWWKAINR